MPKTQQKYHSSANQSFYAWFCQNNYDVPGAVLTMATVRTHLKIIIPKCMTPKDCKNLSLKLLGPIGYTRDRMLSRGMYFGQLNGDFRVMALKDTSQAIEGYANKACNAMIRCETLNKNLGKRYNKHKVANGRALARALVEIVKVKK